MSDDQAAKAPDAPSLTGLDGTVEDTRSLFDQLFGDGDDQVASPVSQAIPVAEVLAADDGPATVATRTVEPPLPSRGRDATAATPRPAAAAPVAAVAAAAAVEAPAEAPFEEVAEPRRRDRGRVRARKVRRIVRHIEPWSVLKVSLFFFLTLWLILLVAGLLLWSLAVNAGGVDSIEDFIEKLMGYEEFHFLPDKIFRAYAVGGLVVCGALTALSVVMTLIFNLISDLLGGIRVTVIEEERIRR